jgi:hypothetical protein
MARTTIKASHTHLLAAQGLLLSVDAKMQCGRCGAGPNKGLLVTFRWQQATDGPYRGFYEGCSEQVLSHTCYPVHAHTVSSSAMVAGQWSQVITFV